MKMKDQADDEEEEDEEEGDEDEEVSVPARRIHQEMI